MRRLLLCSIIALLLPAAAQAGSRVSAFYYPWYGSPAVNGGYRHWQQGGHTPPDDIGANLYMGYAVPPPAYGFDRWAEPLVKLAG